MSKKNEEMSFEVAVSRLQEIVEKLEQGQTPLDDSLQLFEEGVKLSRYCHNKLDEIERKIEVLSKEGTELKAHPFNEAGVD